MKPESWIVPTEDQEKYISSLVDHLPSLRKMAGLSQSDFCSMIGISRQTLSAIERKAARLSWNTYLSMILFFDYNLVTREFLRSLPAYPSEYLLRMNNGKNPNHTLFVSHELQGILKELDDQALHAVRTLILVEYARCKNVSGDAVVKAFEGIHFPGLGSDMDIEIALQSIRNKYHG